MSVLKHDTPKICKVADVTEDMLKFPLTEEQRGKIPRGKKIRFRRSTQPYKEDGYRQFLARAQYTSSVNSKYKGRVVAVATHLIGIVWDDDPEWIYETDKSKSSIKERRIAETAKRHRAHRLLASTIASMFAENIEYAEEAVIVNKVPVPLFLVVAIASSLRGYTDATSVANYWNINLPYLQELFPHLNLQELSHDSVRRIYQSLTEASVQSMLRTFYEWLPKWFPDGDLRHVCVDGQACRASGHHETERQMMTLNAVDVTAGKLCVAHTQIDTKSNEPVFAPELLDSINIKGVTVSFDALNTTRSIADCILKNGGFYLLAVKGNQPKLLEAIQTAIAAAKKDQAEIPENAGDLLTEAGTGTEKAHYRIDNRGTIVVPADRLPKEILDQWPGLEGGCIVEATTTSFRQKKDKTWYQSRETRWFISCHPYGNGEIAEWIASCVRGHWGGGVLPLDDGYDFPSGYDAVSVSRLPVGATNAR